MTQATTAVTTARTGQVAAKTKPVDMLKGVLNADSVKEQFQNALGKNSGSFVASVIDLFNGDRKLQECNPNLVVCEALKAAVLHLPINKSLGYAYIIPFNNCKKIKDDHGVERKVWVLEPVFQMGYKGYIQLAMRTGQYRTLNADVVYEGELSNVTKLTGEIAFDGERVSDKIIGYFCYFELLNGFSKTLYMTVKQMAAHAVRYSKGLKKGTTVNDLMDLAALPLSDAVTVGWNGNFHSMAIKTVIRNLLGKYGYLSIEMQTAIANDFSGEHTDLDKEPEYADATVVNDDNVTYQQVTAAPAAQLPPEPDPGY